MWNNKLKAITFSFDDGVTQDKRLIDILNKYRLKGTFNLNSSLMGLKGELVRNGVTVSHNKINVKDAVKVYDGHEIACHTLTHPNLTMLDQATITHQVERDREVLSDIFGYDVVGMAYPCGGVNHDDRVAEIIKNTTGIRYVRTITSTYNFDLQTNLYKFNPSVYYIENCLFDIAEKFLSEKATAPQLLYVWGHSYEADAGYISWEKFEDFCRTVSGQADVFYGTNKEVLL